MDKVLWERRYPMPLHIGHRGIRQEYLMDKQDEMDNPLILCGNFHQDNELELPLRIEKEVNNHQD